MRGVLRLLGVTVAAVVGFAVPWSYDAAASDPTGMWGVGLIMLLVGGGAALTLVLAVAHAALSRGGSSAQPASGVSA